MINPVDETAQPLPKEVIFEYFRLGLVTGILEKSAVVAWADVEILRNDHPENEVIELSLSGRLPYSQLIGLLNTFQGVSRYTLPVKLILAHAGKLLAAHPEQTASLVAGLRLLNAEDHLPQEVRSSLEDLD